MAKPQKLYRLRKTGGGESLTAEVYQVTGWGEGRVYFPTLKKGMRFEKHWRRRFWTFSSDCHLTNANLVDLGGSRLSYDCCDVNLFLPPLPIWESAHLTLHFFKKKTDEKIEKKKSMHNRQTAVLHAFLLPHLVQNVAAAAAAVVLYIIVSVFGQAAAAGKRDAGSGRRIQSAPLTGEAKKYWNAKIRQLWNLSPPELKCRMELGSFDWRNGVWCSTRRWCPLSKESGLGGDSIEKKSPF